ncbi:MAG: type II toxin-antitoxin system RelE/ParE family toxin [Acidobacteriia bacterium]|nr:type II toxin-antitoxin system RelE/ParE family toxin [Terriglobia bacterium]
MKESRDSWTEGVCPQLFRDLKKLSRGEARRVLDRIEAELSKNAEKYPLLRGPFAGLRKFRVGDYRVIFALLGHDVVILRIGHRRERDATPGTDTSF